jgi:endonuclease III
MGTTDRAKRLATLVNRLRAAHRDDDEIGASGDQCESVGDPVMAEFVRSFLMWEATATKAEAACRKLTAGCVDVNELRVSLVEELVELIGPGYPKAEERCERLKAALNGVFRKENSMLLSHLAQKPKREARAYLEALPEVPAYVVARTMLMAMDGHACPADQRLTSRLIQEKVLEPDTSVEEAGSWLDRTVRAGDAREVHTLLQRWVDEGSSVVVKAGRIKPRKKGTPSAAKRTSAPRAGRKG